MAIAVAIQRYCNICHKRDCNINTGENNGSSDDTCKYTNLVSTR